MSLFNAYTIPSPRRSISVSGAAAIDPGSKLRIDSNTNNLCFEGTKERIKKMFDRIDLSVSSYDTAWVAMVRSPNSPQTPCFPQCLYWLLDNQPYDGSWSLPDRHPLLTKDAMSSTLACVLALRRWGIGEEKMKRGHQFIESNFASVKDENQYTPFGFEIIFSAMIEYAKDLKLNLPLRSTDIDAMLQKRDLELKSIYKETSNGKKAYLAYVSEGIGKLQDWETVMKYQRKNGSLFNSPSTTAAALAYLQTDNCLYYLHTVLQKFGNVVPTIYPFHIHACLSMVETVESLGINRHFRREINSVLEEIYRCWQQGEEDIFLDPATCAMAFRILRNNRYNVSSDLLAQYAEEHFFDAFGGYMDIDAVLELFRASQMIINPDELVLLKQNSWTRNFLKQELSKAYVHADGLGKHIKQKVNDALDFPSHANSEHLARKRNIENYAVDQIRVLKTSYCSSTIGNKDFLMLAVEEFNTCQSIYQEELKHLESWVKEKRLDKLDFARQKMAGCYFSAVEAIGSPELSEARISWAKNAVLATVVDDFFDVGGSEEELVNLIQLVENTICDIGKNAIPWQGRDVTNHVIEIWLDVLYSMLQEANWSRNKSVPTMDEYMENGCVSLALGPIILPALYFVGPRLSKETVKSAEYNDLFRLVSTCGRLLNDIPSFKREFKQGKVNAVPLRMIHGPADVTEEDTIKEIKSYIHDKTRELLRLDLQENGSIVPRACKDLFWNFCKSMHLFYMKDGGYTSHEMINVVKAVLHEPISRNEL